MSVLSNDEPRMSASCLTASGFGCCGCSMAKSRHCIVPVASSANSARGPHCALRRRLHVESPRTPPTEVRQVINTWYHPHLIFRKVVRQLSTTTAAEVSRATAYPDNIQMSMHGVTSSGLQRFLPRQTVLVTRYHGHNY